MPIEMLQALLIPFMGTVLGAGCVFFIRGNLHWKVERAFTGFAAGVMVAASIWSLIIPAMEQSEPMGSLAFLPAVIGFWGGILFLLFRDVISDHHRLVFVQNLVLRDIADKAAVMPAPKSIAVIFWLSS